MPDTLLNTSGNIQSNKAFTNRRLLIHLNKANLSRSLPTAIFLMRMLLKGLMQMQVKGIECICHEICMITGIM